MVREYGGSRGRPFIACKAGGLPMPSPGRRTTGPEFDKASRKLSFTAPHSAATFPASLLDSFASGECLAQRSLPARAKLFGGFGVRHEDIESVEGTRYDQKFRCDSGIDEPARVLHVFFDEQVNGTDTDPGRRQAGDARYPGGTAAAGTLDEPAGTPSSELQARRFALAVHIKWPIEGGTARVLPVRSSSSG